MMLKRFLEYEKREFKAHPDRIIIANEQEMQGSIMLNSGKLIKLKGTADRVESSDKGIRIVDYKTGAKSKTSYRISSKEGETSLEHFIKKPEALQLMLYAYLYRQENPANERPVSAAILSLRKQNENPFEMSFAGKTEMDSALENEFGEILKALLEELFNPDFPFQERGNETEEIENEN
jgi:ATP-dependent helicase/nuclease subunit B